MSSTSKTIHDCVVQIDAPHGDFPGRTAEGRFTFEDGTVTLVDHKGNPLKDYARKIGPDEIPVVVARRLTKQFYLARRGKDRLDFNRPLHYKKDGSVV
jgi:hypothetical protein